MKIKKIGILMIAGTLMCTSPAATVMASDATETVQEIITDNEIDSLVSDPDKVVDIIMYAKDKRNHSGRRGDCRSYTYRRGRK